MSNTPAPDNPGVGVVTTLDTPPDLEAELRAAFESTEFRTTTSAAMQNDPNQPAIDPRTDPAAAAAMAAAVGSSELPAPAADPTVPTAAAPTTPDATGVVAPAGTAPIPVPAVEAILGQPVVTTPPVAATDPGLPPPTDPATTGVGGYDYYFTNRQTGAPEVRHLSDQEIESALGLAAWANELPDPTKAAIAAVEAGQAVAIPRAEFDRYQAFINQSPAVTQQPGQLPGQPQFDGRVGNLGNTPPGPQIDYTNLDPETAQALQAIQQQNAYLAQQFAAQQQVLADQQRTQQVAQQVDAEQATAQQKAVAYDRAIAEYSTQRGLTPEETEALVTGAINANVVPHFEQRHALRNPITGASGAGDPYRVVFDSLDYALYQNPTIHQSVAARASANQNGNGATVDPTLPVTPATRAVAPAPTAPTVNGLAPDISAKKAQASSLATAPSAAVQLPPRDVRDMTQAETTQAMAEDIARVWSGQ